MKTLCNKCKNYEVDGNISFCKEKVWPKTNLSKSRIYNALMFECIDYERPLNPLFNLPKPLPT